MIQDIAYRYNNTYYHIMPENGSVLLSFSGNTVLCQVTENKVRLPMCSDLFKETQNFPPSVYLFGIDDVKYFLVFDLVESAAGYVYNSLFMLRDMEPQHTVFAVLTAFGLHTWYATHIYCGKCGSPNNTHTVERMLICPLCGTMDYPKISPAVIVAITDGDKLLLSKYAGREYAKYALIAGFAESGETIEQTVIREVKEETGLNVKNIRYYKSQPWGLSSSLLFGFFADLDGDNTITIDETELSEARWFARKEIPPVDSVRSLTSEMIELFRSCLNY
ncbi:MAG: NAD(+) diphosphatase [Cytophagaceae bacterium]|nr:NAD(+) diphosphatase [Cytophagaceae bacterium]